MGFDKSQERAAHLIRLPLCSFFFSLTSVLFFFFLGNKKTFPPQTNERSLLPFFLSVSPSASISKADGDDDHDVLFAFGP